MIIGLIKERQNCQQRYHFAAQKGSQLKLQSCDAIKI